MTDDQYIIAAGVTTGANDQKQLHPMLEDAAANPDVAGAEEKIRVGLADAGYCSEKNLTGGLADGPELLVNTTKDWKRRRALREEPPERQGKLELSGRKAANHDTAGIGFMAEFA